ncbi:hypothetical protein BKA83DRAFT_4131345 [Pisolithus microcarpus]|nr:hypothetical protein BKA83DRAFT_4131345 [Pisolithus microcarpus]
MAHASLTADVAVLHATMKEVSLTVSAEVREMCQQLSNMGNLVVKALTSAPACSASSPDDAAMHTVHDPHDSWHPNWHPNSASHQVALPSTHVSDPRGLLIPNVPVLHADGTWTPKSGSWRDIVHHWTEGEPQLGLHTPLKDWPHHYYNG